MDLLDMSKHWVSPRFHDNSDIQMFKYPNVQVYMTIQRWKVCFHILDLSKYMISS